MGIIILAAAQAIAAPPAQSKPAEITRPAANLALGRAYTLSPAPNYSYCTDPDDRTQLTDGQYSAGHFWTRKSTVGWNHTSPCIITVDLGEVQPIRGASYNTAAGVAGVQWPAAIDLLVSDDGKSFRQVGDLVALSRRNGEPPASGYAVHRYWTGDLHAHGRYVSFVVSPMTYCFVDEVEVYAGDKSDLAVELHGPAYPDPKTFHKHGSARRSIIRRLTDDSAALRSLVQSSTIDSSAKAALLKSLDALAPKFDGVPHQMPEDFRAVLPINDIHRDIFAVQAELWRATEPRVAGGKASNLIIWPGRNWDPLPLLTARPISQELAAAPGAAASLNLSMMRNEYRAICFNIANAGDSAQALRVQVTGLPGGVNPAYLSVHEVQWTDTRNLEPVTAALPLARRKGSDYLIDAPAGMIRQVWLTFHPVDVPAGQHPGEIVVTSPTGEQLKLPLSLNLSPLRFPDRPALHLGGWDYADTEKHYDMSAANRDAIIPFLREYFVDSPWGTASVMPYGKHDKDGAMTAPPETERFDRWVARWKGARQYGIFLAVSDRYKNFNAGTAAFERAVTAWLKFWVEHARGLGISPPQLLLHIVDEPHNPEQDATILAWAKVIRAANTGVLIFEDPTHLKPAAANQEMMAASNVLCPNRPLILSNADYRDYYLKQRPKGPALAMYSCSGPVRSLDPYSYHRLQAWSCWKHDGVGEYFWSFGDSGGASSWNEYAAARPGYTPYFLDGSGATPAKHMEAIREGIEDFEYFRMLKLAAVKAAALGSAAAPQQMIERAKKLLSEGPDRVLDASGADSIQWKDSKDRSLADAVRVEVLQALEALSR